MKTLKYFAIAAAVAALAACVQEKPESDAVPGVFRAGIEDATRVAFTDEGVFSWSEGDAVALVTNAGLKPFTLVSGAGSKSASFNGDLTGVTSATAAIYPAAIAKDASTVTLPSEYAWAEGQANAAMIASPVSLADVNVFKHVGGIVKIVCSSIPAEADALVFASDAKITGDFAIQNGIITAGSGSDEVKVTFAAGSNPAAFYIPVPTGTFNFSVSFLKGTEVLGAGRATSEPKTIGRATLLLMDDAAQTTGISTAEDLVAWAAAVNNGLPTAQWENAEGAAVLLNDIDMTGVEWAPVKNLPEGKVLDGQNHAIKNWATRAGKGALMLRCSGTARNIVLDESCQFVWTQGEGSGFIVDTLSKTGLLENCVNHATAATYTEALTVSGCHFNYIAHQINGPVRNCVNYGDINIDVPSCTQNIWAAPIGAFFNVSSLGADVVAVSGCKNYGNVSVHVATCPKKTYIGGVVGGTTDAGSYEKQTVNKGVISECENYGNISYKFDTSNNGNYYNVGGVTAYVEGKVFDCVNEGKVEVMVCMDYTPNPNTRPAIGGVCAFARYGIARCTNKGDIYVEGCYGAGGVTAAGCGMNANPSFAGVVGQVGPSAKSEEFTISDLHNSGTLKTNISMNPTAGTNCFIGGCIGITYYPIDNCDNTGHLDVLSMQRYTMIGGVAGRPFNNVSNCWNSGKIDFDLGDPDAIGPNTGSTKNQRSQAAYVGGIIGDHNQGNTVISDCENRAGGDIVVKGGYTYSVANYYGGIIGRMNTCITELKNCTNYGNLTSVAVPRCIRIGGIVGMGNANKVSGCHNHGSIAGAMDGSANAALGGFMGFLTCNSNNCLVENCSTEGNVDATGSALGGAALFIGGQGNTVQTWTSSTLSGSLTAPAGTLAGYILGGFVLNKVDLVASLTFDAAAPMKIKSGSSFNGTAVSAADLAQNRLLGSIAGTNKSEEAIEAMITYPEGAVVIE